MTLEQFKEKIAEYQICLISADLIYSEDHLKTLAHEIAMNAMDVLKAVTESGFRDGWVSGMNDALDGDSDEAWNNSDTKKRLEE